nr:hypothetical protein [Rhodoferax fermentans]
MQTSDSVGSGGAGPTRQAEHCHLQLFAVTAALMTLALVLMASRQSPGPARAIRPVLPEPSGQFLGEVHCIAHGATVAAGIDATALLKRMDQHRRAIFCRFHHG